MSLRVEYAVQIIPLAWLDLVLDSVVDDICCFSRYLPLGRFLVAEMTLKSHWRLLTLALFDNSYYAPLMVSFGRKWNTGTVDDILQTL